MVISLLVVVRSADDALRTVKMGIVLVPGLKKNTFSSSAATTKGVKTIIEPKGSSDYFSILQRSVFSLHGWIAWSTSIYQVRRKVDEHNLLYAQAHENHFVKSLY